MLYTDVVIVDSGVNQKFFTCDKNLAFGIHLQKQEHSYIINQDVKDIIGHGTAIYNIIRSHNTNAKISILKIMDKDNVDEMVLIQALEYILENITCKIINLSLGICFIKEREKLYNVCNQIFSKGILIIAAFDNHGSISFPAVFDNVLGVVSGEDCFRVNDYNYVEHSVVNLMGKGNLQRVMWLDGKIDVREGNSFACAHITGILSNIWKKEIFDYVELNSYLKMNANHVFVSEEECVQLPRFVLGKRACIFPFNKEIHSLVRFERLLSFSISKLYDSKYSARVGSSTNDLLHINQPVNHIIENIEDITFDAFDMLILGHIDGYIKIPNQKNIIQEIVLECIKLGKKIYSFDDINFLFDNNKEIITSCIFTPQIRKDAANYNPFGMLYRQCYPVLGFFGTSSQQGKFTLQLIIREKLIRDKYKVGQLGSEPTSYLFDMDESYHFGYNACLDLKIPEIISYINYAMYRISQKNPDIILVGSQSGTIPWEFGNLNGYAFNQMQFLLATNPDAVVLSINEYDTIDTIIRTVNFIEASVDCKVIALVVFPMTIDLYNSQYNGMIELSEDKYNSLKKKILNILNKPLYLLGKEQDMDNLYFDILAYFS